GVMQTQAESVSAPTAADRPDPIITADNARQIVPQIRLRQDNLESAGWSSDGKMLAVVWKCNISLYDTIAFDAQPRSLQNKTSFPTGVAFSTDSKLLAAGTTEGEVRVWDVKTGLTVAYLFGHTEMVNSVVFSAGPTPRVGGKLLASGGYDNTVRVWDAHT